MKCLVSVCSYVLFNVLRVNNTAVAKSDTSLLLVEVGLCKRDYRAVLVDSLLIEQILADVAFLEVLLNDSSYTLRSSLSVENALRINDHDRTERTKAEAACSYNEYLVFDALLLELVLKSSKHLFASR